MNNQANIECFKTMPEEDRLQVLKDIRGTCGSWTDPGTLGILQLALDRGTAALTRPQWWRLVLDAWVPNVSPECSRCFGAHLPEEMVVAKLQGDRCSYCENAWQKTLEE